MKASLLLITASLTFAAAGITVEAKPKSSSQEAVVKIQEHDEREMSDRDFDRYMRETGYDYRSHHKANKKLRQRVRQLERAVRQLQRAVYQLEEISDNRHRWQPPKVYSCIIETKMDGTFYGEGHSLIAARAAAKNACEKSTSSFWCREEVECDSNV
ncbi:MAG: hypothetical protein HWE13_05790 [Gammaproteobacteria bacterium]|nr:hypothetical protein [Gammaproteobacteria bacterium]NVK87615.1 hypothetical protein [Gammaproteobacteria bacterium]